MQAGTTAMMMARQNTGGGFPGPLVRVSESQGTSVTPTPNRLQLVALHLFRGSSTAPVAPTSLTGCGLTFDLIGGGNTRTSGSSRGGCYLYRAQAASTSNGTLTFVGGTYGGLQSGGFSWVEVTNAAIGANGATAVVQSKVSAATLGTAVNATFNSAFSSSSNATLVLLGSFQGDVTLDIDSPVVDFAHATSFNAIFGFYQGEDATFSGTAGIAQEMNIIGLEIKS